MKVTDVMVDGHNVAYDVYLDVDSAGFTLDLGGVEVTGAGDIYVSKLDDGVAIEYEGGGYVLVHEDVVVVYAQGLYVSAVMDVEDVSRVTELWQKWL